MKVYRLLIFCIYQTILSLLLSIHFSAVSVEPTETISNKHSIISGIKGLNRAKKSDTSVSQTEEQVLKKNKSSTSLQVTIQLAEMGHVQSMYELGRQYRYNTTLRNDTEAFKWFQKASSAGHYISTHELGQMYRYGHGTERNYKEAFRLFKLATEKGNIISSMYAIGKMYLYGYGIKKNYKKALKWFQKAVDSGNFLALYPIGIMHLNGIGMKQDKKKALQFFERAAHKGHYAAMYELGKMYLHGKVIPRNYEEAFKWLSTAAEKGNHYGAMYESAKMLLNEKKGVPQDKNKALKLLNKAIIGGHHESQTFLSKIQAEQSQHSQQSMKSKHNCLKVFQ